MKVSQFKQVLSRARRLFAESGRPDVAEALDELASLTAGRETMTVASFCKLLQGAPQPSAE